MTPQPERKLTTSRRIGLGFVCLLIATSVWMPLLHLVFKPGDGALRSTVGIAPQARLLAQRHIDLWADSPSHQAEIDRMRINNPEWDFMGRTYLVLSLANMCLREPEREDEYVTVMDRIIADTLKVVDREGIMHFLMDYARAGDFRQQPVRSIFLDGEIALMLGARRLIRENDAYGRRMRELTDITAERIAASPLLSCESYPDECWTFCNTLALAAIRMSDVLDGRDHSALLNGWVDKAKSRLVDPKTGLLCSAYSWDGTIGDGPEGSSIWMAAHCLQLIDPAFAADQYQRARTHLRRACVGFGWASEWPRSWRGPPDIDSGPVIPILEVSAGSSGLAFVGAAAFDDAGYYDELATTLMFAAFPVRKNGRMMFCASNQVGDAVMLYSTVVGPLWARVNQLAVEGGGV
jgi:hypothetical protein